MEVDVELDRETLHSRNLGLTERTATLQLYRAQRDVLEKGNQTTNEESEYVQRLACSLDTISAVLDCVEEREEESAKIAAEVVPSN